MYDFLNCYRRVVVSLDNQERYHFCGILLLKVATDIKSTSLVDEEKAEACSYNPLVQP